MKKLKKINLELNKEVISSLSGNEMNNVKGGTNLSLNPNVNCTGTDPLSLNGNSCPEPVTRNDFTCVVNVCEIRDTDACGSYKSGCVMCWSVALSDGSCPATFCGC